MGGDNVLIMPAALPNLTGKYEQNNMTTNFVAGDGVYSEITSHGGGNLRTGDAGVHFIYKFNASKSSPIYQDDCKTVQPPAFMLLPQIKF